MIRLFTILVLLIIVFVGGLASGGISISHESKQCVQGTPKFDHWTQVYRLGGISFNWPTFSESCKFYFYPDSNELIPANLDQNQ